MDVLRALASPNLDIRRKTIDIVLELITQRNIDEANPTLSPSHRPHALVSERWIAPVFVYLRFSVHLSLFC